jgi:hypothetical protein
VFEAQRQSVENELQSEKALRQQFLDRITEFAGQSINRLKSFADQAEAADKAGLWHSPACLAILAALSDDPPGTF